MKKAFIVLSIFLLVACDGNIVLCNSDGSLTYKNLDIFGSVKDLRSYHQVCQMTSDDSFVVRNK